MIRCPKPKTESACAASGEVAGRIGSRITRRGFLWTLSTCAAAAAGLLAGCSGASDDAASGSPSGTELGKEPESPKQHEQLTNTLFVFDTVVTLQACCSQETMDAASERCNYFESIFSRTIDTSDIGRINAAGGKPVEVAAETADIIQKALKYCEESEGRFDITIGAATSLWDFKEAVVPDKGELAEAVKHIDYRNVQVDGTTVTLLDPLAKLDLGGIAKGYIADDLCAFFIAQGCDSGLVNLGGNTKTIGLKADGSAWRVGIQDPNGAQGAVVAAVDSHDTSVVTSGLYERQFTKNGKKYWHILDPKTGYPAETDLISASIVSDSSTDGDGYATPMCLMGHDEALAWMNAKEGVEGMVVDESGTITQTDGCHADLL